MSDHQWKIERSQNFVRYENCLCLRCGFVFTRNAKGEHYLPCITDDILEKLPNCDDYLVQEILDE